MAESKIADIKQNCRSLNHNTAVAANALTKIKDSIFYKVESLHVLQMYENTVTDYINIRKLKIRRWTD